MAMDRINRYTRELTSLPVEYLSAITWYWFYIVIDLLNVYRSVSVVVINEPGTLWLDAEDKNVFQMSSVEVWLVFAIEKGHFFLDISFAYTAFLNNRPFHTFCVQIKVIFKLFIY